MERVTKKLKLKKQVKTTLKPARDLLLKKVFYPIPKDVIMKHILPKLMRDVSYCVLMMAVTFDERIDGFFMDNCALGGYLNLVIWAHHRNKGCELTDVTSSFAVKSGNVELVRWLYENDCPFSEKILGSVRSLNVMQYLVDKGFRIHSFTNGMKIGKNCDTETLKWLMWSECAKGYDISIIAGATKTGKLDFLKWCKEDNFVWNYIPWSMLNIACSGNLEMLKWAIDNGSEFGDNIFFSRLAAKKGHIEMLKWALTNGCRYDNVWICAELAQRGDLDTLKWARNFGCPWDSWTFYYAAKEGHYDIMQWVKEQGCPVNMYANCRMKEQKLQWGRETGII